VSSRGGVAGKDQRGMRGEGAVQVGGDYEKTRTASKKRASKKGLCMHCGKATGPGGAQMKLFRCKCGNEFHHLCAGNRGHDDMSSCMDCSK
jgi:hypothetical protein